MTDEWVEVVAAECHRQWSGWTKHLLGKMERLDDEFLTLESAWKDRWKKQIETPYSDLSEDEKESDRREARKILAALGPLISPLNTYHNWHEEGGGLVVPTGYGFALYEVPQYGGKPVFSGHYETLDEAKEEASKWT